jgi:hypothetical protein
LTEEYKLIDKAKAAAATAVEKVKEQIDMQ